MEFYRLLKILEHITPEQKALTDPYNDPAKLNFKFLIDFDFPAGLFADASHTNSALAYLERIGDDTRYKLLETFIEQFKGIIRHYEYLFLAVEGLELIQNMRPSQNFGGDSDKIVLKMSEAVDFKVQGLITTYRYILFDNIRGVQVLPSNLQSFNCQIFVYNYGYYNSILYDVDENAKDNVEALIFPTIKKVVNNSFHEMNHVLFTLKRCKFDVMESGKDFLSTVANNMDSEAATNNITFGFKFGEIDARFNNIMGQFNFGALMAFASIQQNHENGVNAIESRNIELDAERVSDQVKNGLFTFQERQLERLKSHINSRKQIITDTIDSFTGDEFRNQMMRKFTDAALEYGTNIPFVRSVLDTVNNIDQFIIGGFDPVGGIADKIIRKSFDALPGSGSGNPSVVPDVMANNNQKSDYTGIKLIEYNVYDGNL